MPCFVPLSADERGGLASLLMFPNLIGETDDARGVREMEDVMALARRHRTSSGNLIQR